MPGSGAASESSSVPPTLPFRRESRDIRVEGLIASSDGSAMDREGLRVVPEATPLVEEEGAQPAEHGAGTGTASGDHVRTAGRRGTFRALGSRPFRLYFAGQVASASGTFVQHCLACR